MFVIRSKLTKGSRVQRANRLEMQSHIFNTVDDMNPALLTTRNIP